MKRYHISFAGAGRVASSLCRALYEAGHFIDTVVSDGGRSAEKLASECKAEWSVELLYPASTQVIIVSVPDARLRQVLEDIRFSESTLVAHTAGSYGLDIFPETITFKGVFYPLQTFSQGRPVDFSSIPLLIEANDKNSEGILTELALSIGRNVLYIDAEKRRMLHVAAVFVCNFTNYMLTSGKQIAEKAGYSLDILEPLVRETIAKAFEEDPEKSQTGPAMRRDMLTIEKHLKILSEMPELKEVYETISRSITEHYKQ